MIGECAKRANIFYTNLNVFVRGGNVSISSRGVRLKYKFEHILNFERLIVEPFSVLLKLKNR